jgi:hypothetical protein
MNDDEDYAEDFDEWMDDDDETTAVVVKFIAASSGLMVPAPEKEPYKLNAFDRCDRCGVQAWVEVTFSNSTTLLFCSHHYNKNYMALTGNPDVVNVLDERERLTVNRIPEVL